MGAELIGYVPFSCLFLLQRCHRNLFRRNGKLIEPLAYGISDCIRNRRQRCIDNNLADGFRTERAFALVAVSNSTRILPMSTRAGILYWKSEFSIG